MKFKFFYTKKYKIIFSIIDNGFATYHDFRALLNQPKKYRELLKNEKVKKLMDM